MIKNNKNLISMSLGIALTSGLVSTTAQAAIVSDLYITEIMTNPSAVSDTAGEWFELYNPTSETVDLQGIILSDDGANTHTISTGSSLLIAAGDYFVMARNGDTSVNGGVNADYVYSNFSLGNTADQIVFSNGITDLLRLDYTGGFGVAGNSVELIGLPMNELNYALTEGSLTYGLGDIGTPGAAGSFTPTPSPVPVPAAVWLFSSGLAGLVGISRRRKAKI